MSTTIGKTWLSGNSSTTLIIPKELAAKHKLVDTDVIFEEKDGRLTVRRLEV